MIFPGDAGLDAKLMPATYNDWDPRIGIVYQPKFLPHTSFRAGFGIFTGPLQYSAYNHTSDIAPFSPTFSFNSMSIQVTRRTRPSDPLRRTLDRELSVCTRRAANVPIGRSVRP